ncbi:MAG: N-acetylmuramoyl-L-alanine amidase [Kiritimatiellae bacterium]|nr:N-acetylmuramoyl-L-alanine amidase [Kiritimatiellia bacterium]
MRGLLAVLLVLACGLCRALNLSNAYLSPRNSERAVRANTQYIILHTTEAEAKSSLRKLSKNGEAHYCVDRDGKVYRIVDRRKVAYHCGTSMWSGRRNIDEVSVGIEVVGYHDRALTSAQYAALKELVLLLQKLYNVKDANVMPHAQVAYGTPNRWHRRSHRGRKRCGMGYATPGVRKLLGLKERWLSDPDVKARRLTVGDDFLAKVLYAKNGDQLLPYKLPGAKGVKATPKKTSVVAKAVSKVKAVVPVQTHAKEILIAKGQTAWDVAREAYNAATTLYIFPDGKRITGDKITDWEALVAGTKVVLGDENAAPVQTLTAGTHPKALIGDAVMAADTWYVRPTGGRIQGSKLTAKTLQALPPGTKILTGYAMCGPVTSKNLPSKLCPTRWDAPDTYYLFPGKPLQAAASIDMKRVPAGTYIFYKN